MSKINFFSIKEPNIAIHFSTQEQLESLCDILDNLGYAFGTEGSSVQEIKELGIRYFAGTDNQYLSLDKDLCGRKFVSCGIGYQDVKYDFNRIEWNLKSKSTVQ